MTVKDYLIDHRDFDWGSLLSEWVWLLPQESFTVWLMNRFGDLFIVHEDGTISHLDTGSGTLERVAENQDHFCERIDEDGNADDWLMIPLVDQMVEKGLVLSEGRCYSFRTLPVLGGEYAYENIVTLPIAEHFGVCGSIHWQIKDLTDGAKVKLRISPTQ